MTIEIELGRKGRAFLWALAAFALLALADLVRSSFSAEDVAPVLVVSFGAYMAWGICLAGCVGKVFWNLVGEVQ